MDMQQLLHEHGDCLAGNGSVMSARYKILRGLNQLLHDKRQEADFIEANVQRQKAFQEDKRKTEDEVHLLTQQIQAVHEKYSPDIDERQKEIRILEHEVEVTEEHLRALRLKLRTLSIDLESAVSVRDSKTSGFVHQRDDLLRHLHDLTSGGARDISQSVDGVGRSSLKENERLLEAASLESSALEQGVVLWKELIDEMKALENSLQLLIDSSRQRPSSEDVKREMISLIKASKTKISTLFDTAQQNKWNLMMIIIGQELAALEEAQKNITSRT